MSARAPLGKPSRNTGSVDAVCTSATQIGDVVSEVIIQADATSFIHMQIFAISQALHSMRKTGRRNGSSADSDVDAGSMMGGVSVFASGGGKGGIGRYYSVRDDIGLDDKRGLGLLLVLACESFDVRSADKLLRSCKCNASLAPALHASSASPGTDYLIKPSAFIASCTFGRCATRAMKALMFGHLTRSMPWMEVQLRTVNR